MESRFIWICCDWARFASTFIAALVHATQRTDLASTPVTPTRFAESDMAKLL
jgi:hypothetical protein